ncbi:MAG: hypothetical protein HZB81_01835 [Deltaproteobacteria bacterium]|nr:hypothetical protein [Deltaproteobacteria bacterium]
MGKNSKEHYHDKAEQDFSKGKYEKPSGPLDLFTKSGDKFVSDCEAYDKGYKNAKEQSKK